MHTTVYHVIKARKCDDHEPKHGETVQYHSDKKETMTVKDEKFEMEATADYRPDGKNEVHFKGKVTLKDEDYYKYITKHGHHFSKALSEHLVEDLTSANAKISYDKAEEILKHSDNDLEDGHTIGDLHYIANLIKARHSTTTVKSDAHVIMLAVECLNDPNKSEGEVFCEWFDTLKRKNKKIEWGKFL